MNCNLPGSSIHGILQARILEWVAISFFGGSSRPRDWTQVSCIAGRFFTVWATICHRVEASLGFLVFREKELFSGDRESKSKDWCKDCGPAWNHGWWAPGPGGSGPQWEDEWKPWDAALLPAGAFLSGNAWMVFSSWQGERDWEASVDLEMGDRGRCLMGA